MFKKFLLFLLVLLFPTCSRDVRPKDHSILLQFKPEKGSVYRISTFSHRKTVQTVMGRNLVNQKELNYTFTVSIESISSNNGNRTLKITVNHIHYQEQDPDRPLFFDSESNQTSIPLELQGYAFLTGKSFFVTTSLNGSIVSLDSKEIFKEMYSSFKDNNKVLLSIQNLYNPTTLKEITLTLLPFFSAQRVVTNSTWSRILERFKPFPLILEQTYSLKQRENRNSVIDLTANIKPWTAKESVARKAPNDINYTLNYLLKGTENQTLLIDERAGWIKELQGSQHLEGTVKPIQGNRFQKIPKNLIWPIQIETTFKMKSERIKP